MASGSNDSNESNVTSFDSKVIAHAAVIPMNHILTCVISGKFYPPPGKTPGGVIDVDLHGLTCGAHADQRFMLHRNESSGDELPDLDTLTDTELEAQLKSLRDKLALVGKESAELNRELRTLERQSLSSSHSAGLIDEAFELYKKHDTTGMFQEMINMASDFRPRLGILTRRREEFQSGDVLRKNHQNGLFNATIEELQEFLDEIATS